MIQTLNREFQIIRVYTQLIPLNHRIQMNLNKKTELWIT